MADVNPMDLDPKTRSVKYYGNTMGIFIYLGFYGSFHELGPWFGSFSSPRMKISQWMKLPYPTELTGVMLDVTYNSWDEPPSNLGKNLLFY